MGKRAVSWRAPHHFNGLFAWFDVLPAVDARATMYRLPTICLLLMAAGNAWAQQDDQDVHPSGSDKRLEFRDQLLDSCQKRVQEFNNMFTSAGLKKPSKAMLNSYCACVGREAMSRFTDEDLEALSREDKSMDDDDIDFKLGQIVNACVMPLLVAQ